MFKELFTESLKLKKNTKYKITTYDENHKPMDEIIAIFKYTGKGTESPNKGKDVYVFNNNGEKLVVGVWEVDSKFVSVEPFI